MTQIMKLNRPIYKSIRSTVLWHNWIALSMTGWTYLWGNWMNLSTSQFDTTGWPLQWLTLLDGPICDRTGLTRLLHNWYVLSLTQLDGPIYNTSGLTNLYVIQTDGSIYNIRISLYIYMTQRDRPYMKLMDGPVIDKTGSPELYCPILDTEGVPCL